MEIYCPYCDFPNCMATRCHDEGDEYQCIRCHRRHTRREENPEAAYVFFPGDLYRAFRDDIQPILLDPAGGVA